jgi:hypothetical protein
MSRSSIRFQLRATGIGGKIGLTLFFLFWMGIPALMLVFLGRPALQTADTYAWKKTKCVILDSRVVEPGADSGKSYAFVVKYRYTWQGRHYTSDKLSLSGKSSSNYADVQKLAERYAMEANAVCYVNPAAPDQAILQRDSLWFLAIGLVPLGFVAFGALTLFWVWRGAKEKPAQQPLSTKPRGSAGPGCLILFFSIFLLAGLAATYAMLLRPALRILAARSWREVPCVVLSSRVVAHSDSDGTTYSVDILYSYAVDGRELKANRYNFMTGSTSGYEGKAAIVARSLPGQRTVCYVNPADPTDAVLTRDATPDMWFGLLPLIFVAVGGGGMFFVWRAAKRKGGDPMALKSSRRSKESGITAGPVPAGAAVLKSAGSRLGKFAGGVLIAAFWNGIVSVFLWQVIKSFQRHRPEWLLTIFLIPFVLIGLGLLGFAGYSFLQLFAPGVKLRLSSAAVPLGGSADLEWEITGRSSAISKLRIWLEGREEATYRRGTSTSTDKSTFATLELASASLWSDIRRGRVRFTVPADTMHSFKSDNNRIVWTLHVHGDIAFYPDVNDEFPITVLSAH